MREFTCKEGLLLKEELRLGKWKKRWMVLRVNERGDPSLYYYKVDDYINESTPLGFIIPSCCTLFENFAFELVAPPSFTSSPRPATHFRFQATSTDEFKSWMSVLGLYTMAIEDLHHIAQSGSGELVRSHSEEGQSSEVPAPVMLRSPPSQPRSKQWEDNEAVLSKLFPDLELQTIVDALDFCHGNRNDAIDLLAEQNKLSRSEGSRDIHEQSPSGSYEVHSDPSTSHNYSAQGPLRLPFSWHRTKSPLIPDPTFTPFSPNVEPPKELLSHDEDYLQSPPPPPPAPPLPLPLQRPKAMRPDPAPQPTIFASPHQSPHHSPQQFSQHSPHQAPSQAPLMHHSRKAVNLQQLLIPATHVPILSETPASRSPSPSPPSTPSLPAPDTAPQPSPAYPHHPHYAHYQKTQANDYQPLISPNTPQISPQSLPKLPLEPSPLQSPHSSTSATSSYTATTPTSPSTPTTPSSPFSPPTSPRLHQYQITNYRYAYRQSAPSLTQTLQRSESYSSDSSDDHSLYHSHSHPQLTGGFANYNPSGYVSRGSAPSSFSSLGSPETSKSSLKVQHSLAQILGFRIVGATRNTYYMDYIVEVLTPELRWLVYRRYSNFSLLNAKLLKLGLAHPTKNVLPPKQFSLPPLAAPFASDNLVQKRIDGLGAYLNSLVYDHSSFFLNHPVGQTFVDPHITSNEHNKVINSIPK